MLYLAEFERGAVLPFHLPAVIFGMSYQTPVECIVCPCEEAATCVSMTDEAADAFHSHLSGQEHPQIGDFSIAGGMKGLTKL